MTEKKLISVIVPCYNEEEVLPLFYKEITKVSAQMQEKYPELTFEYLFVDDGSKDRTLSKLRIMARYDSRVRYVSFSRNFGKESGIYAGLKESKGDYCVVMDADLQHPPAFLPKMYETVKSGQYDCATTRRVSREGESKVRSWFARRFYGIMNRISQTEIVDGAQDFRFMTRQMVDAVLSMSEYNRFSKGIFSWVGFRTKYLEYRNVERAAGKSSWSFWGLLKYSLEGMMGYSTAPLTATAGIGLVMFLLGIIMLIFTVVKKLCVGEPVAGFPTLFCTILLFGGLQLLCTGIVGLYLGKTYLEVKRRPIYIVRETEKDADKDADAESPKDAAAPAAGTEDDGYDDDEYDEYDDDEFDDEYDDDGEYEDEYEDAEDEAANAPAAPVRAAAVPVPVPVQVAAKKSEPQRPAKEDSLARAQRLKEETDAEFEALVDAAFEEADAQKKAANAEKKTPAAEAAPAETPEQKKEKFVVNINYDNDDLYDDYDDEEEYDDDEYEDDYEDEYDEAPVRPQPAARAAAARPAARAAAVRGVAAAAEKEDAPSFGQKVKSFFKSLKDKISAAFAKSPEDQEPEEDEYDDEAYDDYDEEYDEYDDGFDGSEDDYDDYEDDDSDYEDDDDFEDDDDYDDFDDEDDPSDGRHGYRGAHY